MDPKTQWLCLIAGIVLVVVGLVRLYSQGDWTLLIISVLIVAFTVSGMLRRRSGDKGGKAP